MANTRDDFVESTKRTLARRVGYCCSEPGCGVSTEGPHTNSEKYLSVGVAAHITAASPLGPRFNPNLSREQRRSIENGIWLCETHAKLIDKDPDRFSETLLSEWKKNAETRAQNGEIGSVGYSDSTEWIDSGQLMTVEEFVSFYHNHAGEWVTPIDNPLIGRETENQEVESCLAEHKVVVLGGAPGVGKTKFAIEFLRAKRDNEKLPVFVIRDNHQNVWMDVQRLKRKEQKFVLLIDDADRQLPLVKQIITLIKSSSSRDEIQLLLTVRSIAKRDLEDCLQTIGWREVRLAGPTEDSIRRMVSGAPYNISDEAVIRRIIQVSHNNARFAMMVARLAKDDPSVLRTGKIGDIYRAYYQRYIQNIEELNAPAYVRVLGLLAIFRVVRMDADSKATFAALLSFVGMSRKEFLNCVAGLEKRELVEREYEVVKMDDQHLRAYYFYRAFMEDCLLDFGNLLTQFYYPTDRRFRNAVYAASENFGKPEVLATLGGALTSFSESLDGERLTAFYENFGDLWPERALDFVGAIVMRTPKVANPVFAKISKDNANRNYTEDRLLRLIAGNLQNGDSEFRQALDLSFEYVRRKPELVEDLVTQLGSISHYEYRNDDENAARKQLFFKILLKGVNANDALSQRVFLEMIDNYLRGATGVRSFLLEYRQYTEQIKLGRAPIFAPLRTQLWPALSQLYDNFPAEVATIVKLTTFRRVKSYRQLLEVDRECLIDLFSRKFAAKRVKEALIVQEVVNWLTTKKVVSEELTAVKLAYLTPEIQLYDALSWREGEYLTRVRGRDANGYAKQKRQDLEEAFDFVTIGDFVAFLALLQKIYFLPEANSNRIGISVDFILADTCKKDHDLGVACVKRLIETIGPRANAAYNTIREAVTDSPERASCFIAMLDELPLDQASFWRHCAFHWIEPSFITEGIRKSFTHFISTFQNGEDLRLETIRKFSSSSVEFGEYLRSWHETVTGGSIQPQYADLNELTEAELVNNFSTVKGLYLVFGRDDIFDMERKLLMRILDRDVKFFMKYVDKIVSQPAIGQLTRRDEELGFIWSFPEATEMMSSCLESILHDRYVSVAAISLSSLDSHFDPFFTKIEKGREQAEAFSINYVGHNYSDVRKCRSMVDCIGKNLRPITKLVLYRFLDSTQDAEDFAKIDWGSLIRNYDEDSDGYGTDENIWVVLQRILDDYPGKESIFEVKQFVRNRLKWALRSEEKRQRDVFIGHQW
jgi:hypothetical protein